MTSHKDHSHPATKAARRACRLDAKIADIAGAQVGYKLTLTDRPYIQLVNNGTLKHRVLALVFGKPPVGGSPRYAVSPIGGGSQAA